MINKKTEERAKRIYQTASTIKRKVGDAVNNPKVKEFTKNAQYGLQIAGGAMGLPMSGETRKRMYDSKFGQNMREGWKKLNEPKEPLYKVIKRKLEIK